MEENAMQNLDQKPENESLGMGWHKFLINFALWAGALLQMFSAAGYFTGGIYSGAAGEVYGACPGLRVLDLANGFLVGALAVYVILTRAALAGFRRKGPKMLTGMYVFSMGITLAYTLGLTVVSEVPFGVLAMDLLGSILSSGLMIFINSRYYRNRQHLFTGD